MVYGKNKKKASQISTIWCPLVFIIAFTLILIAPVAFISFHEPDIKVTIL